MQERLRQQPVPPPAATDPAAEPEALERARARADAVHNPAMAAIEGVLSVDSRQFNTANVQTTGQ